MSCSSKDQQPNQQRPLSFSSQWHGSIDRAKALTRQAGIVAANVLTLFKVLPPLEGDATGPKDKGVQERVEEHKAREAVPASGDRRRKTLALDLDGTLICRAHPSDCIEKYGGQYFVSHDDGYLGQQAWKILYGNGEERFIKRRPYAIGFLEEMAKSFDIVLFTDSTKERADKIVSMVLDTEGKIFSKILSREDCTPIKPTPVTPKGHTAKDLSRLTQNLGDVILVDNSVEVFLHHFNNGVPAVTWNGDPRDRELLDLILPLLYLSTVGGVRGEIPRLSRLHRKVYRALSKHPDQYAKVFAMLNLPPEVEEQIRGENWLEDPLPETASLVSAPPHKAT